MRAAAGLAGILFLTSIASAQTERDRVLSAMKAAATCFREEVAYRGGYVYYYSPDLQTRLGEGAARSTEIWVQPPGTPTVGIAFLAAYGATKDGYYLEAAREAAAALLHGQLESGGWRNSIDFDPAGPRVDQYRKGGGKGKNYSTLDDGITQSALLFLIELDRILEGSDADVGESVSYGLDRLLEAQFPNGAFPQVWQGPVEDRPVLAAGFPTYDWKTEGRIKNYWDHYTLNDGVADSVAEVLLSAWKTYQDERFREAAAALGGFLKLAQLPEPQPGWAQQYSPGMHPIWARAFEPPAVSGRESEDAMVALLRIAEATGDSAFLEPIVPAVKYLERSLLPDGRLARYYELETNRPLYMVRSGGGYELTHDDSRLPGHYGWKNPHRLDEIKDGYRKVVAGHPVFSAANPKPVDRDRVREVLDQLDEQGRWITTHDPDGPALVGQPKFRPGEEYLSSEVFSANLTLLADFLAP